MNRRTGRTRIIPVLLSLLLIVAVPMPAHADRNSPWVIDGDVLAVGEIAGPVAPNALMIQAVSWPGSAYTYVLTVYNDTPWTVPALRILDRYFPPDPELPEVTNEWFAPALAPGKATSVALRITHGVVPDGCHQLEVRIADGLGTVLMDCSPPGSTTIWQVPLTPEMETYLALPALTLTRSEGGSKLGLHVTMNSSPSIMEFAREAQPAVVVAVGDLGWLADLKDASPETITVARLNEPDQSISGDPRERARAFVADHLSFYREHPAVDYWLGWNEPVINSSADMAWYAEFEAERTQVMAQHGFMVAVGNFSVGVPEPSEIESFLPALEAARAHGGVWALHEYSAPHMREGVGAGVPGMALNDEYGALTLRYRIWYDHFLKARDLVLPLIITEAGIDGGVLRGQDYGGWRDFATSEHLGDDLDTAARRYVEQLSWYDDQLRRDPYVLGFAVFNAGDMDGRWASFDVTDILPLLTYMSAGKSPAH